MARIGRVSPLIGTRTPRLQPAPKIADQLYTSPQWRALISRIKRERGPYCQRCGSAHRVIADHIVEIRDGGAPFDPKNIELLCQAHHNAKTATARAKRARTAI